MKQLSPLGQRICADCGVRPAMPRKGSVGMHPSRCEVCAKAAKRKSWRDHSRRYRAKESPELRCARMSRTRTWRAKQNPQILARKAWLRKLRQYGISFSQFKALWQRQKGKCAICGGSMALRPERREVCECVIDHCHRTGAVRGLLHRGCNAGLGQLGDNVHTLQRAINYLNAAALGASAEAA